MSSTKNIPLELRTAFVESIAKKIGIEIREKEQSVLEQKIYLRISALRLSSAEQYYQYLHLPGVDSEREWQHLAELLTNNESYFFRDREQLNLLKERIFPEIIQRKRQQNNLTLRVWSAGCSTGQEPYSLAIILREIIPDIDSWNLSIFGTDIDLGALNQARAGLYSDWSFRNTEPRIKQLYFDPIAKNYQIIPPIRQMVTFQRVNLLTDQFPQLFSGIQDIDLIVCRNVFIYFGLSTIAEILDKFYHTLRPSGYLLVGHSELASQNLSRFQIKIFSHSLIYQRREPDSLAAKNAIFSPAANKNQQLPPLAAITAVKAPKQPPMRIPASAKQIKLTNNPLLDSLSLQAASSSSTPQAINKLLEQAENLWRGQQSNLAIKKAEQVLQLQPENVAAYYLLGKIYLDLGQDDLAMAMGDRALAINPIDLNINYLLAEIALKGGELLAAKKIFKKILYLDPESIKARIELARIYQQEGDKTRATKIRQQAIEILQQLPNAKILPSVNNLTVAELIFKLKTNS
ncbi:MAG: CheR family methyltransferase [Waterburya sp.]